MEELSLGLVTSLYLIFKELGEDSREHVLKRKSSFGHVISILLSLLNQDKGKALQLACLKALMRMTHEVGLEISLPFFPGVSSALWNANPYS